jgi:hypothetical protein
MKQISVFIENKPGTLANVTDIIAAAGVNLRALSIGDTADFGILRIVVDNAQAALKALHDAKCSTRELDVLAVEIEDKPGTLAEVIRTFSREGINVEYLYPCLNSESNKAVFVFKTPDYTKAHDIARKHNIALVDKF